MIFSALGDNVLLTYFCRSDKIYVLYTSIRLIDEQINKQENKHPRRSPRTAAGVCVGGDRKL